MQNDFLRELDHWILAMLHDRLGPGSGGGPGRKVGATEFAWLVCDYVLLRLATEPSSGWNSCDLDDASDEQIMAATTFPPDLLAAGFLGAVGELEAWEGDAGIAFMVANGVPDDDAADIARAVSSVAAKLEARGQALVHRGAPVYA